MSDFPQKFGSYVLLGPLGEGGMGAVYLAMSGHREMETLCVVKRLRPALQSQPEHVRRFRHEADLARRLVHSNLAHTHNVGEVDGEVFLVQEFVEGHDVSALLDELASRRRAFPVPVAIYIASEIARGLAYAHAFENLDLVHRDINPPNIRLTYAGEVKLLDFGIASSNLHGDVLSEHRGAGKLWHLAPEQVRPGAVVDRRTDIYALGVVLWELLAQRPVGTVREAGRDGRQPETEGEILVWIARGQHQAPSVFNREVPPELDALVVKATHSNPEYRHTSADDLRRELAAFLPAGFHPEPVLAALMKELFSPEAERAERRRVVEAARHLLQTSSAHRRARTRASDVKSVPVAEGRARKWLLGLASLGIILLVGLALLARPRPRVASPPASKPGAAQPAASEPAAGPAPSRSPVKVVSGPSQVLPEPAVRRTAAEVETPPCPVATATRTEAGAASLAPKTDHLRLAREAFNARDWARALGEGRSAVAAGGGADAYALLGNTYFKMGRFADAEQAYAKAVVIEPKNALLSDRLRIARVRARDGKRGEEN
ncbi:MAG: protein kinase [Deltaproteobacteria bacterium]|nr:protein kinase [Deltaproteobacteria bacterium]